MAGLAVPLMEGAVAELGPLLARAGAALLGGAAVAGTDSVSGDAAKEGSKATPAVRAVPRTGESCKKCPPEGGAKIRRNHGVNWNSYRYQARITGFAFDEVNCQWSDEWQWMGIDFDGFRQGECLLQEAKGDFDQFLDDDGDPAFFFTGFDTMRNQIWRQSVVVKASPPAQLMWYFMTPHAREYVMLDLRRAGVPSVHQP